MSSNAISRLPPDELEDDFLSEDEGDDVASTAATREKIVPTNNRVKSSKPIAAKDEDDEGESLGSQDSEDEESEDDSIHTSDEEMIADSDEEEPEVGQSDEEELLNSDEDDESSEEDDDIWIGEDECGSSELEEDVSESEDESATEDPKQGKLVMVAPPIVLRREAPANGRYSLRRQIKPVERYRDEFFEELMNASDSEEERREGHLWDAKPPGKNAPRKQAAEKSTGGKRRKL